MDWGRRASAILVDDNANENDWISLQEKNDVDNDRLSKIEKEIKTEIND